MAGVFGTCAGSVSPWNTHIGGEEWGLPDARVFESWTTRDQVAEYDAGWRYWNLEAPTLDQVKAVFHPYQNGYVNEVSIDDSAGDVKITAGKHYAMGRYAIELAKCLPTSPQVCYITDDKTNGIPCAYKPDVANDLSGGELFCAKVRRHARQNRVDCFWCSRSLSLALPTIFTV